MQRRCGWCGDDPLYQEYHDTQWGVPLHDERALFEFLCLEGAQAGLSWLTVLRKREHYKKVFDDFNAEKIAAYDDQKITQLLQDPGIIRNKRKVNAFINNARCSLDMQEKGESLNNFFWSFVDGTPIQNSWKTLAEVPAATPLASLVAKELKSRGFTFVGPTICYALMQAIGMFNDHTIDCFRYQELFSISDL